ncbi:ethylbenzene dehydrogenase-related protein [Acidimangrovimonas sediminis]|uniref:ethylbenzene dehydrogenase-related protein n=1 Tax=Acidimangrovimonas sediminis TaxID=2056283 RepID=UPI000C800F6C|nr:ethylbenzene dehydrogenase-related protein [Acidimangrovimonas sediminis]
MPIFRSRPLLAALVTAGLVCGALIATDRALGRKLVVHAVADEAAPVLDGDTSDAVWQGIAPVTVLTAHGGDFGGTGESRVQVRAVHDSRYLYLAIVWQDPTPSRADHPLVRHDNHWHLASAGSVAGAGAARPGTGPTAGKAGDAPQVDDRFAIMLAPPGRQLIGAAIHLGRKPLADAPGGISGRGLHYTGKGTMIDIWQWRAATAGLSPRVVDSWLGPPQPVTRAESVHDARYAGGLELDSASAAVGRANFTGGDGPCGTVEPLRLPLLRPTPVSAVAAGADPGRDARPLPWDMTEPYTEDAAAGLRDGAVLPGVLVDDDVRPGPDDVTARAHWDGGYWVLEVRRSLAAGPHDLPVRDGMMMWFAAFDHAETRHTYHLRPLVLELGR